MTGRLQRPAHAPATSDEAGAMIMMHSVAAVSTRPGCSAQSGRGHSRHRRHLADLPIAGRPVRAAVVAGHFMPDCPSAVCEACSSVALYGISEALGGAPAVSFALRCMMPVSNRSPATVV